MELKTLPQAALLYRLNGDWNPVHIDPATARAAGFERPILHGLCIFGIAARAVLQVCCPGEPKRVKSFSARFSTPMFPGETLSVELWNVGSGVHFRAFAKERGALALSHGVAEL